MFQWFRLRSSGRNAPALVVRTHKSFLAVSSEKPGPVSIPTVQLFAARPNCRLNMKGRSPTYLPLSKPERSVFFYGSCSDSGSEQNILAAPIPKKNVPVSCVAPHLNIDADGADAADDTRDVQYSPALTPHSTYLGEPGEPGTGHPVPSVLSRGLIHPLRTSCSGCRSIR